MMDRQLNVVIFCEESQTICRAFRELGHIAFSCDLQTCSGGHPEWHIHGDCLPYLDRLTAGFDFTTQDGQQQHIGPVDLMIAHPPCTFFSAASAVRLFPGGMLDQERYQKGLEYKKLFDACLNAPCPHVAVENPTPLKIFRLPPSQQIIQPWQFSDGTENYTKRTCLWLKGLPNLVPSVTTKPEDCIPFVSAGTFCIRGGQTVRRHKCGKTKGSKNRSKTFEGIAKAIAQQWSCYILSEDGI